MARKFLSIIILFSMVLHCAGRLGGLSYLYERRFDIAFSVGLISEKPIAMCSGSYFEKGLTMISPEHDAPVLGIVQAHDINLFCVKIFKLPLKAPVLTCAWPVTRFTDQYDLNAISSIFHPPLG